MTGQKPGTNVWPGKWATALLLLAMCLVSFAISFHAHRGEIELFQFRDPDDAMRLVEVRDFLAGQSWFDVSQHRANPPFGGPMHWSRLVDLPIAAVILALRPFLGSHLAEVSALLLVPTITLAALLAAFYWASRALQNRTDALLGCVALIASPTVLVQFPVMRIDHHAWQIVMAVLAVGGSLDRKAARGGIIAGLAIAAWLQISIEGLPFAALTGAAMAFRYGSSPVQWKRLSAYIWTLAAVSASLFLLTHGWKESRIAYCDAFSPVYLVPLVAAPFILSASRWICGDKTLARRLLTASLTGCASLLIFVGNNNGCLAGPFHSLDPLIYQFWYREVFEGLPLWDQTRDWICFIVFSSGFAILGNVMAISRESDYWHKLNWITILILLLGATFLALLVFRTFFVAQVFGLPGSIYLVRVLFQRSRSMRSVLLRVPATAISSILLFPMVTAAAMAESFGAIDYPATGRVIVPIPAGELTALESVAPATIFAPIDLGPSILFRTRNSIIGTGHHRNAKGMKLVISAFLASPQQARAIISGTSATYLLIGLTGETERYERKSPQGLAAQLLAGKPPSWLRPVQIPGLQALRLYRVDRESHPGG